MINSNVIAITGIAGSGKETFAKMIKLALFNKVYATRVGANKTNFCDYWKIKENFDSVDIIHFSTPLKEIASILEGVDVSVYSDRATKEAHRPFVIALGDAIKGMNPNILLDVTKRTISNPAKFWIIEDLRLPNEVDYIKENNIPIIKIVRPNIELVNNHITETNIENIQEDIRVVNGGTFDDLFIEAEKIVDLIDFKFHLS